MATRPTLAEAAERRMPGAAALMLGVLAGGLLALTALISSNLSLDRFGWPAVLLMAVVTVTSYGLAHRMIAPLDDPAIHLSQRSRVALCLLGVIFSYSLMATGMTFSAMGDVKPLQMIEKPAPGPPARAEDKEVAR